MSIRTAVPTHVGRLRNKISSNFTDDEYSLIGEQAARHVPPLSPTGLLRQAWLDWSFDRGEIVPANEPAAKAMLAAAPVKKAAGRKK